MNCQILTVAQSGRLIFRGGAMGRRYAAVLGLLTFAVILARGIAARGTWESVIGLAGGRVNGINPR